MASPLKRMVPAVGGRKPLRRLKQVVFPAPFGPMRPTISPASTVRSTTVDRGEPAEVLGEIVRVSSRGIAIARHGLGRRRRLLALPPPESGQLAGQGDEATGEEQDRQQHRDGKEDRLVRAPPERLGEQREKDRADDGADKCPRPPTKL